MLSAQLAALMFRTLAAIGFLVTGCGEISSTPTGDPAVAFKNELQGRAYNADVALGDGAETGDGRPLWAAAIFAEFAPASDADIPALIEPLPVAACAFEKPSEGALVRLVHVVDGGANRAPVYTIDNQSIADRAKNFVNYYFTTRKEQASFAWSLASDAVSLVNVAVTEATAPVYLVLTAHSDTIFNITVAPGARLERIAVIGSSVVGVANAPEGVMVEGLYGGALYRCGAQPERMPEPHWGYVRNVKEHNIGGDLLAKQRARLEIRTVVQHDIRRQRAGLCRRDVGVDRSDRAGARVARSADTAERARRRTISSVAGRRHIRRRRRRLSRHDAQDCARGCDPGCGRRP
jgi:hypothetical protein